MAVQYPPHSSSENHSNRVGRGMESCGVDHRGFLLGLNQGVVLGKNAFQVPSMAGSNQYHLFNQLTSGGRQGYATQQQQQQQLDAAALLNGVTEKEQIHAANVMMSGGSRKRARDQQAVEEFCSPWPNVATPQPFVITGVAQLDTQHGSVVNPQSTTNGVSTGLRLASFERSASPVSTSGRSPADPKPTWSENFASHLQQERDEVTQLLKIQNEQLKSFIEEKRQRQARQVIAAAEEGFQRHMRERDAEMERVRRQNQELLERFAQLNAESQHWQSKVRSTEAMVSLLRSTLAQAQAQNAAAAAATPALVLGHKQQQQHLEGCGDSDGAGAGAADDCASSYVDDVNDAHTRARNENRELREQRTCRVCRSNDVSMLLLPCRHLCLCHECEGQLAACPLCRTPKNASVQVYMS